MLSEKERAYNFETMRHIERVRNLLNTVIKELLRRGETHDQSKLQSPEVEILAKAVPLKGITFGSDEYKAGLASVKPALDHHYAKNRHHPQFHKNGVNDMTLIDLIEMFVDWKASSERHADGNILTSIDYNSNAYRLSEQLTKIFTNTAHALEN